MTSTGGTVLNSRGFKNCRNPQIVLNCCFATELNFALKLHFWLSHFEKKFGMLPPQLVNENYRKFNSSVSKMCKKYEGKFLQTIQLEMH